MAEPLKNLYSKTLVESIAARIKQEFPRFKADEFINHVLDAAWHSLELKERMRRISSLLGNYLPDDFPTAIEILKPVTNDFTGLEHMYFPGLCRVIWVGASRNFAGRSRILYAKFKFGVCCRPFIIKYPGESMKRMKRWTRSKSEHVRRLASEGCRPRLPWAAALPEFKRNPTPVLDIILPLIEDDSLYVRRSVANNLNDISKDHPETVIGIARDYIGRSDEANWVIKHACRGLLKRVISRFCRYSATPLRNTSN